VRRICRYLPLFFLLLFCIQLADAQSQFDIAVGFGAVQDKASTNGIEGDPTSANFFNGCAVGSTSTCTAPKSLSGFMIGFQGNLLLWKMFGLGAEVTVQPAKANYVTFPASAINAGGANLQSRATFFDFNGIMQPVKTKKAALQLEAGIGGANLKFYAAGSTTNAITGTQNFSQYFGSSNHFQVHAGAGVNIYVSGGFIIRPQFDIHYVPNLTQYGRNLVTEETVWVGYSWGSQ
jgi:hypothetical protein